MKQFMGTVAVCALLLAVCGCGGTQKIYLEQTATEDVEGISDAESAASEDGFGDENKSDTESAASEDGFGDENATESGNLTADSQNTRLFVYVCGAVVKPGVYELPEGARVYEAVERAGGLCEDACADAVNLAEPVCDAQMIWIPTEEEAEQEGLTAQQTSGVSSEDKAASASGDLSEDGSAAESDGKINLNTATAEQLMTLPGIGQAKADSILSYREENGGFSSAREIMNVEGIKEGVYNRIKDQIGVE